MLFDSTAERPERWLARFDDSAFCAHMARSCGYEQSELDVRVRVWRSALHTFLRRFGSKPVVLARCPGRVNLRGMHVDTHGGYLNVMTHQRETVVVAARSEGNVSRVANCDRAFPEFTFRPDEEPRPDPREWESFIRNSDVEARTKPLRGTWGLYIVGCAQSLRARLGIPVPASEAVVASDLPRGAALSASHALCVAMLLACESIAGTELAPRDRILAARDAEWYAGARTGTSDQSAMILGQADMVLYGPLPPSDLDLTHVRPIAWPHELSLVVAQSFTTRNLSGAERIAYTANRFANSLALEILRDALHATPGDLRHLCQVTEERYATVELLEAVRRIPERLPMEVLRARCTGDVFEEAFDRYFGNATAAERPHEVPLRGPLLFGIAESERARRFGQYLEEGRFREAGALMTIGHDGDRRLDASGNPYESRVDDATLLAFESTGAPISNLPGAYGASSPALDALVDAALASGAYGASLTGAGIAGVVLALCAKVDEERVVHGLRGVLQSEEYRRRANLHEPVSQEQAEGEVLVNRAPAGAGVVSAER